MSNLRGIQFKDIVKKVEDYLKTYSSSKIGYQMGPSETKDTKIAALRLKFNAFIALEEDRVNGTFTRLKSLLNDFENNGVSISQAELCMANTTMKKDSDSNIEEDQKSSSEFLAVLNVEFHERALPANQRRFYKRSGRMGSPKKLIDMSNETCFACGKLGHFQKDCPSIKTSTPPYPSAIKYKGLKAKIFVLTKKIDAMNKGNSEKGLVAESFDWDEESVSSDDKGVITFKALMAIADEELSVGRVDARSGQGVEITMQKNYLKRSVWYLDSGDTEGYSSVNCNGITFTKGTTFNQNNEVVLIAPRRRDVYVIDMSSYNKESNASCEKEKHHRASFKTKRSFSINKCLHILYMDLFRPVKPQSISCNKYTLVIVDEYSRYTWVFCLKKKSDAVDCIISFIKQMENLNEVKIKELRSDDGTEFKNHRLEEFCDEKGISQNFSYPYTPKQNGVVERRNRSLIEAARTMLNSANLPKFFWGETVNTASCAQNRPIIVKRHVKTAYDVFRGRSPDISYFYVFECLVHIHNHIDHLGKFDEKDDDGFFLGYSPVAKAFRVFNIRRQEMEETYHVTFSEDDEVISQSSTEGDAINFNENRSFPDDEFPEPMRNIIQGTCNNKHLPYIPTYDPLSS
ncbi:retrovirus-related pol polyprotein from transposon TNT 1-94 [Tanacetum coccineum]